MSNGMPPSDWYTLGDLIGSWDRGELTLEEVLQRWPHPQATREELLRDILRIVMVLRMRIAAIDGIGDW